MYSFLFQYCLCNVFVTVKEFDPQTCTWSSLRTYGSSPVWLFCLYFIIRKASTVFTHFTLPEICLIYFPNLCWHFSIYFRAHVVVNQWLLLATLWLCLAGKVMGDHFWMICTFLILRPWLGMNLRPRKFYEENLFSWLTDISNFFGTNDCIFMFWVWVPTG